MAPCLARTFRDRVPGVQRSSTLRLARDREKARRNFWSPRLMGGLTRGRGRSRNSRGIPKKKSRSRHSVNSVLQYLIYIIQAEGRSAPKNVLKIISSQIYFSTSSLFVLSFPTNPHCFFNDSEKHIKSSVRTRLALFIL